MEKLPKRITENGIDYVLAGDYYIPALRLTEESRPIGRWGRLRKSLSGRSPPRPLFKPFAFGKSLDVSC